MILADTSIWIEHLRRKHKHFTEYLIEGQVLIHPFVSGELSCGNLQNRRGFFELLCLLPSSKIADHDEVMNFIESKRLYGRGLGWVDAHLLVSSLLSRADLWTLDSRLYEIASDLNIAFQL